PFNNAPSRSNMPPSARGSSSGLRRISSFVKPGLTSPAVARAVHHPAVSRIPPDFAPEDEREVDEVPEAPGRPEGFPPPGVGFPVPALGLASRSSFNETGGTSTAPGH